jgi:hypothetical protein
MILDKRVIWGVPLQTPFERLNIVNGAKVDDKFLESLQFIGYAGYDLLNKIFEDDEMKTVKWFWKCQRVMYPTSIYLFASKVEQQLRFGGTRCLHFEDWIFGAFVCNDDTVRLCPLKRESDICLEEAEGTSVKEALTHMTRQNVRLPWQTYHTFSYGIPVGNNSRDASSFSEER